MMENVDANWVMSTFEPGDQKHDGNSVEFK